ncbi:MAG TPA: hypothetical protein VGC64_02860 [Pyrinomonadaceae bacterium]
MNTQSLTYHLLSGLLRLALVLALIFAGLSIYRKLPGDSLTESPATDAQTALLIVLEPAPEDREVAMNIPIELYPIDLSAAQREYLSERRPGVRFDDFLTHKLDGKATVETKLDEHGQATVLVTPGKWWVHAVLSGAQSVEWRLPVNVAGLKQTIELTPDNAYAKMKSF